MKCKLARNTSKLQQKRPSFSAFLPSPMIRGSTLPEELYQPVIYKTILTDSKTVCVARSEAGYRRAAKGKRLQ